METVEDKKAIKGGEFIIRETKANEIFIPEEWSEEQQMIANMCYDFIKNEIMPHVEDIDKMKEGLMPSILDKAGELGLLGLSIPEDLGGMGLDFKTSLLATEALGGSYSFSVAYGAHTGIGTLPLLYYGNDDQKQKYIPKLATGEWKAAYCLTEPSSGSDANSGKSRATLSDDGKHYILNGQKMWITNGGFANLHTVFAKIDDDENLSAFLVEANWEGITLNAEEKKMGIKGSSTRQIFYNNVKVPVENLLSTRGNGFKIALNILNIGRIKLAAGVVGASKATTNLGIKYANEREQFGRPISKYGAIRQKLAKSATRIYAVEAATFRAGQNIDDAIKALIEGGMEKGQATLKGIEQFAAECAMLKVAGSECLDYVVDEMLQIHGGMGYSAESMVERAYRDARINRIFEGTNEINRMLTVDMLLRKAMKGDLDLMGPAMKVAGELMSVPTSETKEGDFAIEHEYIANFKKTILMVAGSAVQKLMNSLAKEQEVLMSISDMLIDTYVSESVLLRVEKLASQKGKEAVADQIAMAQAYIYDASDRIHKAGKDALNSFADGDELRMMIMGLKRFTKHDSLNIKNINQQIAQTLIDKGEYAY